MLGSRKQPQASRSEVKAEVRLAMVVVVKVGGRLARVVS